MTTRAPAYAGKGPPEILERFGVRATPDFPGRNALHHKILCFERRNLTRAPSRSTLLHIYRPPPHRTAYGASESQSPPFPECSVLSDTFRRRAVDKRSRRRAKRKINKMNSKTNKKRAAIRKPRSLAMGRPCSTNLRSANPPRVKRSLFKRYDYEKVR